MCAWIDWCQERAHEAGEDERALFVLTESDRNSYKKARTKLQEFVEEKRRQLSARDQAT
jgi:hypothetical protein